MKGNIMRLTISGILSITVMAMAWIPVLVNQETLGAETDRYWLGVKSGDANNTGNWSQTSGGDDSAGVPASTNDVFYNGDGNNACSLSVSRSIKSFTMISAYTAAYKDKGFWDTVGGTYNISPGGTFTGTGGVLISSPGNIVLGNSGTYTTSGWSVRFNANGNYQQAKSGVSAKQIAIGKGVAVETNGAQSFLFTSNPPLLFDSAGQLTTTTAGQLRLSATGNWITATVGIPTIDIQGTLTLTIGGHSITATLPTILFTHTSSTGGLLLDCVSNYTGWTMALGGNLTLESGFTVRNSNAGSGRFVTNNYDVTINGTYYNFGNVNAAGTMTHVFGSSDVTVVGNVNSTLINTGTIIDSLQSSNWVVKRNWVWPSNHTVVPGTSTVTFSDTFSDTITSNGKSFYDLVINKAGNGITLYDSLTVLGDLTLLNGSFNQNGKHIYVAGDLNITTDEAVLFSAGIDVGGEINSSGTVTLNQFKCNTLNVTGGTLAVTDHAGADTVAGGMTIANGATWANATDTTYIGGNLTLGATSTISATTGKWILGKDGVTLAVNGKSIPLVQLIGSANLTSSAATGGTLAGLTMPAAGGDTVNFQAAKKFTITTTSNADRHGTAKNYWRCATLGQRDTIAFGNRTRDTLRNHWIQGQYFIEDTVQCKRADSCVSGGYNN